MFYVEKAFYSLEMFKFLYKIKDNLQGYASSQKVLNQELLGHSESAQKFVSSYKEGDLMLKFLSYHSFSNRQHLARRTIWNNGKDTVASCKKMVAIVKNSKHKDGLPPGHTLLTILDMLESNIGKPLGSIRSLKNWKIELMLQLKLLMLVMMIMMITIKMRMT
jgi:hypothetical protein